MPPPTSLLSRGKQCREKSQKRLQPARVLLQLGRKPRKHSLWLATRLVLIIYLLCVGTCLTR